MVIHITSIALSSQVDGSSSNCLFGAIKKTLGVHHSKSPDYPFYPCQYFRHEVVAWIVKHQQLVYQNKFTSLMLNYGLDEETAQYKGPLSFKNYLRHLLQREFWGDEVVLYAISCMWGLKISVLNSRTLQEYCICHDVPFTDADMCVVYNARCHYSAQVHLVTLLILLFLLLVGMLVTLLGQIISCHMNK